MRKVAKIRDNSLFSATTEGATETMILLSICQTCLMNLVNPQRYIEYYLKNYNSINKNNLDEFLPTNPKLPQELFYSKKEIEK